MSDLENSKYYKSKLIQYKVHYYMVKAAVSVMAEAADTAKHAERVVFAKTILAGSASVPLYALGVTTNATVKGHIDAGTSYDDLLEFTVNSLFTAYAGGAL